MKKKELSTQVTQSVTGGQSSGTSITDISMK